MSIIDELAEYFKKLPGVGPRQANRFVYYLLKQDLLFTNELSSRINQLKKEVSVCPQCFLNFTSRNKDRHNHDELCDICSNPNRDIEKLMIVSHDVDVKSIEKSNVYNGLYFVIGGLVPITWNNPQRIIKLNQLESKIEKNESKIKEIILSLSANPDGENTSNIIKERIESLADKQNIKITILGRGLSTGTEIEYSDSETLKNAFKNRF